MANKPESAVPTTVDLQGNRRIKGFIISLVSHAPAMHATRKLLASIESTNSEIETTILPATTPATISSHLGGLTRVTNKAWTWPTNHVKSGLDLKTGLYLKAYGATDQKKVVACMVSHMRAWQQCIDLNEPIMVLEQDAQFVRTFKWSHLIHPTAASGRDPKTGQLTSYPADGSFSTGGIVGLNDPRGATRKATIYHTKASQNVGIHKVPSVDDIGDPPLPQGLAGNSAYVIKPWAALKLFKKINEVGMWPNDALMCKQFFPWMQQAFPYFTRVQGTESTTTR